MTSKNLLLLLILISNALYCQTELKEEDLNITAYKAIKLKSPFDVTVLGSFRDEPLDAGEYKVPILELNKEFFYLLTVDKTGSVEHIWVKKNSLKSLKRIYLKSDTIVRIQEFDIETQRLHKESFYDKNYRYEKEVYYHENGNIRFLRNEKQHINDKSIYHTEEYFDEQSNLKSKHIYDNKLGFSDEYKNGILVKRESSKNLGDKEEIKIIYFNPDGAISSELIFYKTPKYSSYEEYLKLISSRQTFYTSDGKIEKIVEKNYNSDEKETKADGSYVTKNHINGGLETKEYDKNGKLNQSHFVKYPSVNGEE